MDNGYVYVSEDSVYFDVVKYNRDYRYGILSGRNLEDVLHASRELDGQEEKRHAVDFALWKKATLLPPANENIEPTLFNGSKWKRTLRSRYTNSAKLFFLF